MAPHTRFLTVPDRLLCPARVASHPRLCAPGAAPDRRRAAGAAEAEFLPAHGLVPADRPVHARLCHDVRRRPRQPCPPAIAVRTEDELIVVLRDLANWLYRALEREYEFPTSDETVDEGMSANGYTFTAEGRRFRIPKPTGPHGTGWNGWPTAPAPTESRSRRSGPSSAISTTTCDCLAGRRSASRFCRS